MKKKDKYKVLLTIKGRYAQQITFYSKGEAEKMKIKMLKRGYMGTHVTRVVTIYKNGRQISKNKMFS